MSVERNNATNEANNNPRINHEDMKTIERRSRYISCKNHNSNIAKVDYQGERHTKSVPRLKKFIATVLISIALLAATIGVAIGNGVNKLIDDYEENKIIHEQLDDYATIVANNTHRTQDNQNYWYDTYDIAREVLKSEDPNLALYQVYDKIGYNTNNKLKMMDEVIGHMGSIVEGSPEKYEGFATYENFNDYLIKTGCVKDGKASTSVYSERLRNYALAKGMAENANETFTDMRGNEEVSPKGK